VVHTLLGQTALHDSEERSRPMPSRARAVKDWEALSLKMPGHYITDSCSQSARLPTYSFTDSLDSRAAEA
jgi:hypothetical protein